MKEERSSGKQRMVIEPVLWSQRHEGWHNDNRGATRAWDLLGGRQIPHFGGCCPFGSCGQSLNTYHPPRAVDDGQVCDRSHTCLFGAFKIRRTGIFLGSWFITLIYCNHVVVITTRRLMSAQPRITRTPPPPPGRWESSPSLHPRNSFSFTSMCSCPSYLAQWAHYVVPLSLSLSQLVLHPQMLESFASYVGIDRHKPT
jgi:hypothetical protein